MKNITKSITGVKKSKTERMLRGSWAIRIWPGSFYITGNCVPCYVKTMSGMGRMPAGSVFSYGLCSECTDLTELLQNPVTVQPAELLRHPSIKNRFAMGRMPVGSVFSYGLCSECTDLTELLQNPFKSIA